MKRWRRPLILIALLLLVGGGAVVNVAVALAIVWRMEDPSGFASGSGAPPAFHLRPDGRHFTSVHWSSARWRPVIVAPGGWWVVEVTHTHHVDVSRSRYSAMRATTGVGWPLLALRLAWDKDPLMPRAAVPGRAGGAVLPARFVDRSTLRATDGRLPIDPIVPGFLANTLFYAAILALPLTFFPIRRRLRARRGRCPKCGYDLAGLGGAGRGGEGGAPCPECGAVR